jgi:hypothetical protein
MAALYGAGAYTGSNPIGGGSGYVSDHGFSLGTADYVVETWAEFKSACGSATSGKVIWVPAGLTLTMASGFDYAVIPAGVAVASNRGAGGALGAKLKQPYAVGGTGHYMSPIIWPNSNCIISGLVLEGPGCFAAPDESKTNAAIRCVASSKRVEIENCELYNFYQGGLYLYGGRPSPWNLDSSVGRHWLHHCKVHGMQRHGFGYGVQVEGGSSVLAECCDFYACRHFIAGGNTGNCYEIRYCTIADSWYRSLGTGPITGNTQLDAHANSGSPAGMYTWIHHNTLSNNSTLYPPGKESIGIRGIPSVECLVYNNWTKKTYLKGLHSETLSYSNHLACSSYEDGGAISGANMNTRKLWVYDNWYGLDNPDDSHAPVVATKAATAVTTAGATLNGQVESLGLDTSVTVSFEYGETTAYGSASATAVVGAATFSLAITGLVAGTTYHFRAKAIGAKGGTVYGSDLTFVALATSSAPAATTGTAQNIGNTTATITGTLTGMGSATTVNVCLEYGTTTAYGSTTALQPKTAVGAFQAALVGLVAGTTYHFRAKAVGDSTVYGADGEFTTTSGDTPAVCTTRPATSVGHDSATLRASVVGLSDTQVCVKRGFKWGTTSGVYTGEWSELGTWTAPGNFGHTVTGLTPQTAYYFMGFIELA